MKEENDKRDAKNRKTLTSDIIKMTKASVPETVMENISGKEILGISQCQIQQPCILALL